MLPDNFIMLHRELREAAEAPIVVHILKGRPSDMPCTLFYHDKVAVFDIEAYGLEESVCVS